MEVKLIKVRGAFLHLFDPQAPMEGSDGKAKFGGNFIYKAGDSNDKAIKAAVAAVSAEVWKGNAAKVLAALESGKRCYRVGNENLSKAGEVYDGFADMLYIVAKNAVRVPLFDLDKTPLTEADGRPYPGCYVNVIVDIYAMQKPGIRGVFATLKGVQFAEDGDAFTANRIANSDDFDDVSAPVDDNDV